MWLGIGERACAPGTACRSPGFEGSAMATFSVGNAAIDTALELELTGRPIDSLGAAPELIEANRWWLAPHFLQDGDVWSLNFRSWIVRVDDKVIVVDPCNGNGRPNPMPLFDMLDIP